MTEQKFIYHNDEPTSHDLLDRGQYASSFAQFCKQCTTPLTVGLYASWGVGKTSLMRQIESQLDKNEFHIIWFNAWEHQFVNDPILALSHTITAGLGEDSRNKIKKLLALVAIALGSQVLKTSTGLKVLEFIKLGNTYEEEQFQNHDNSIKLKHHLEQLLCKVRKLTNKNKVVFFIDDLDRCSADQSLKLLEALKLYLNIENCIFFVGVDREALQQIIKTKYADLPSDEINYLDKIIQLPFTIPMIEPTQLKTYIEALLYVELHECKELLEKGLGGNPRQVKRFINNLLFNHGLARNRIIEYKPTILCALLLVQHRKPDLYRSVSKEPEILSKLQEEGEQADNLRTYYLGNDLELEGILKRLQLPRLESIAHYIYLTDTTGIQVDIALEEESAFEDQKRYEEYDFSQFYDEDELRDILNKTGEVVIETLLIFRTPKQQTWLITTHKFIICVLDDEETRSKNAIIQWREAIKKNLNVHAHTSHKGNAVIDIGVKKNWLYTKRLFPEATELEEKVRSMIANALTE